VAKDLSHIDELMKDIATCDRKQFEDKGLAPYTLRVFANIVVASNEDHPVKIADRERRWVAIKCMEELTGDHDYFTSLHEFLDQPENQRGIYQSLMAHDISRVKNMQKERPITEYYRQCCSIFSCHLAKFLSALCSLHKSGKKSFKASAQSVPRLCLVCGEGKAGRQGVERDGFWEQDAGLRGRRCRGGCWW